LSIARQALVVLGLCAALLVPATLRFGIWDPWEVTAADAARVLSEGGAPEDSDARPALPALVSSLGFRAFGLSEVAGRIPLVLVCLLAPFALFLAIARAFGCRAAWYTVAALVGMPLFSWNAVSMAGEGMTMTGHALVLAGFVELRLVPPDRRSAALGLGAMLAGALVGAFARDLVLGTSAPLLACGLAAASLGDLKPSSGARRILVAAGLLATGMAAGVAGVIHALADPGDGKFLSFEIGIEHVAHATFPWVALAVPALAWLVRGDDDLEDPERTAQAGLGAVVFGFLSLSFAAHAFRSSLWGEVPFPAVAALAAAAGVYLRRVEVRGEPALAVSLVAACAVLIVVRDSALFPQTGLQPFGLREAEIPEGYAVGRWYAIGAAVFLVAAHFPLARGRDGAAPLDLRAPYRFLWGLGSALGAWRRFALRSLAGAYGLYVLVAVVLYATPALLPGVPGIARRALLAVAALPLAVAAGAALYQALDAGFARIGERRFLAVPVAGTLVTLLWLHAFLPSVSNQFSARETFDTYARLRRSGDLLAEFRVPGKSAAFYSGGKAKSLRSVTAAAEELAGRRRSFIVFARKELAPLDQAFRKRTGRHLVVVDDRSRWLMLGANRAIEGERDRNPVSRFVRSSAPPPGHRLEAELEGGKILFHGYDLEPDEAIAAGDEFTITWHIEMAERFAGSHKVFVHIDGHGQRLNGDHDPVDGLYPLRYWSPGDHVLDRQTLRVPVNYRAGDYTIFLGFFQGSSRLEVTEGPNDGDDRIRAGVLRVR